MPKVGERGPVGAPESMIDRAIRIMKVFEPGESAVTLAQLASRTDLPKSSVHRLVNVLVRHNLMRAAGSGSYALGVGLWELGSLAVSSMASLTDLEPFARTTAEKFGETCHIGVLDGRDVVYIVRVSSNKTVGVQTHLGQRVPAHCTATGKALLAWQSDDVIEALLADPLQGFTDRTLTTPEALWEELHLIRRRGYATNYAGWQSDMCGAAAPILGRGGNAIGSIGIAGPTYRFDQATLDSVGEEMRAISGELSRRMGYIG